MKQTKWAQQIDKQVLHSKQAKQNNQSLLKKNRQLVADMKSQIKWIELILKENKVWMDLTVTNPSDYNTTMKNNKFHKLGHIMYTRMPTLKEAVDSLSRTVEDSGLDISDQFGNSVWTDYI